MFTFGQRGGNDATCRGVEGKKKERKKKKGRKAGSRNGRASAYNATSADVIGFSEASSPTDSPLMLPRTGPIVKAEPP